MNPYSAAQTSLAMSDRLNGIPGMTSRVAPGPNLFDGGAISKPQVNSQPAENQLLAEQNFMQNMSSAIPQAQANAMGKVRSEVAAQSDAEGKAQLFASERMSEALYANQSGSALMELNAVLQSPEKAKFMNGIAVGKAMTAGMSPDLGGEVATKNQYM